MARVYQVKAARKSTKCQKCGGEIQVGQPYKWAKPRAGKWTSGFKLVRCGNCVFKPSELMTGKMAGVYAAVEGYEEQQATHPNDLVEAMNMAAEEIRGVAEEYREGAQNIEDGFGHSTSQSEEMQEKGDELEGWVDQIESAASELEDLSREMDQLTESEEGFDPDNDAKCFGCGESQPSGDTWGAGCNKCGYDAVQRLEGIMEEAQSQADEQMGSCPV